jgi:replication-associated recombination protein RarA
MSQSGIDQAIRSRSMMIDLSMNSEQKLERMAHIAESDEFLPEYDATIKSDALALITEIKDDVKEISLRTLIAVSKIRSANKDWKDLATYMLTA